MAALAVNAKLGVPLVLRRFPGSPARSVNLSRLLLSVWHPKKPEAGSMPAAGFIMRHKEKSPAV
ncbi:hypothetical protein CO676_25525 [Sinorhizobium sp. BJ1]|nr:hypothetical protein CO676_25525 [Sinorhizobium sp. BJ1]